MPLYFLVLSTYLALSIIQNQPEIPQYNAIFATMDGCKPCLQLKSDLKEEDDVFDKMHEINISSIESEAEYYNISYRGLENLLEEYKISRVPAVLIFKTYRGKFFYLGRIEGYSNKKNFISMVNSIKKNKNKGSLSKNSSVLEKIFQKYHVR